MRAPRFLGLVLLSPLSALSAPAETPNPAPEESRDEGAETPQGSNAESAAKPEAELAPRASLEEELGALLQPGGLTSKRVAERTVDTSARVEAKRRAEASAAASASQVAQRFFPRLELSARYTRLSEVTMPAFGTSEGVSQVFVQGESSTATPVGPSDQLMKVTPPPFAFPVLLNNFELKATLSVPLSDYLLRMSTAIGAANEALYGAEWNRKAEALLVQTDAKIAYYEWVKALGARYIAQKSVSQVQAALRDVQQSFEIGTASKADVLRTEAQYNQAKLLLSRAERGVHVATEAIRTLQHDPPGAQYSVGENILEDVIVDAPATLEAAYQEAREKRLELRALKAVESSYRKQAEAARKDNYPRLDAVGNAIYANPNQRIIPNLGTWDGTWDASLVLSWTPTAIPGVQSGARALDAKAAEYAAQRQAMEDGLRMEVAQALSALEEAQSAVITAREVLRASEEGERVSRELFRVGRATALELSDAQTNLTRARLELFFSHVEVRIARERLMHALGRDVTE